MKWLFLTKHNHPVGGLQSRSRELALALLDAGHDIDFVCYGFDVFADVRERHPIRARLIAAPEINTRALSLWSLRKVWGLYRAARPDAVFFCNVGVPDFFPFILLARLAGVRHVVAHHGANVAVPGCIPGRRRFGGLVRGIGLWRKRFMITARLACRGVTLALFNNSHQRDRFVEAYGYAPRRCELWWPPVDLRRFSSDLEARRRMRQELGVESSFVIVGIGRLGPQKAFDVAIRALPEVLGRFPNALLLLAGEGEHDESLRLLASSLGVDDHIRFLGRCSNVPEVLNVADLLVVTATDPNETLGIVILEAMAVGTPCVVSDLAGPKRVAGDGEYAMVVPRGDYEALAEAILGLSRDPTLRTELAQRAAKRAAECDRDRVARRLLDRLACPQSKAIAGTRQGESVPIMISAKSAAGIASRPFRNRH